MTKDREDLRKLHNVMRTINNMPNAAICTTTRDLQTGVLKFDYVGATWEKLMGVSAEASKTDAHSVFKNVHPDDLPTLMHIITESLKSVSNFEIEVRYIHPVAEKVIWMVIFSYSRCDGDCVLSDGFIYDISIRKFAEIEAERKSKV